jgi:hypothetical protein
MCTAIELEPGAKYKVSMVWPSKLATGSVLTMRNFSGLRKVSAHRADA